MGYVLKQAFPMCFNFPGGTEENRENTVMGRRTQDAIVTEH
jgi:hypothetical protein